MRIQIASCLNWIIGYLRAFEDTYMLLEHMVIASQFFESNMSIDSLLWHNSP